MLKYQVVHERMCNDGQWRTKSELYSGTDKQIAMITLMSAYKVIVANAKERDLDLSRIRIIETHEG